MLADVVVLLMMMMMVVVAAVVVKGRRVCSVSSFPQTGPTIPTHICVQQWSSVHHLPQ